ncbi:glycoprotein FP21 precursor [Reticulomyxa filosa]|uniref:Glycoprotein FP21 n=1 Tax=Reticulomyxa filosa TaxID=46433 RepID=X6N3E2_RETFI|nr:glycoprotein FP21 precursor [Reticulomyxa filosa]|eukprot:ETO20274.1 glycoprotein FP21 precursor [Reticulomyxa filosa]
MSVLFTSKKAVLFVYVASEKQNYLMCYASTTEIPIKKVKGEILALIVEYLKHHNGKIPAEIAKPIRSVKMEKIVEDKWDADFINNMSKKVIFQVILGANYMDVPSLLHLGCAKIATLIKGKSPDEIKQILSDDSDKVETKTDA